MDESTIFLAENSKLKLKKILIYNPEILSRIENNLSEKLKYELNFTNLNNENTNPNDKILINS